jgi:hypothetical protein
LEATTTHWDNSRRSAFEKELQAHVSHICHLDIIGTSSGLYGIIYHTFIASPAPTLEYLSVSHIATERGPYWRTTIPNKIFKGTTPRLSFLQLDHIDIGWNLPILKGLRYLKINKINDDNRDSITEWLDALDEMPHLKELVLHAASPFATSRLKFPLDIKRTATLPVLTHLDLSSSATGCALALAHLVLPALTSLVIEASYAGYDALILLPYVTQHAHGSQDTQPLQSVLFHSDGECTYIVAWPTPDIHVVAHRQSVLEVAKRTARIALSFTCDARVGYTSTYVRVLDATIEALPLGSLVTLTAEHRARLDERVWLRHALKWPLLEHVQLAPRAARGLREMLLLDDNGGHECPLLPSLRQLDLLGKTSLTECRTLRLCDALKKRVEQGVPLKVLDLRICNWTIDAVRLLRTFVDEVRGPKGNTSWKEEGPSALDPETCDFVYAYDDSDEEEEGRDDSDEMEDDDDEEEEEDDDEEEGDGNDNDSDNDEEVY